VSNDNSETDCTVGITLENLAALLTGDLEPATGFMMGKFKVSGDMSVAMKLQRVV
jgi:putative sterol carrier protein